MHDARMEFSASADKTAIINGQMVISTLQPLHLRNIGVLFHYIACM